jgi:hypothetical protein
MKQCNSKRQSESSQMLSRLKTKASVCAGDDDSLALETDGRAWRCLEDLADVHLENI